MITALIFLAIPKTVPLRGMALLDDISHRAFNYFWEQSPHTFALDRAPNYPGVAPRPASNNPASIATIGFELSACAIGAHNRWVSRKDALNRAIETAETMFTKAPEKDGWFYHWINPDDQSIMWGSEVSTIDSAIYFDGLMLADGFFKDPRLTEIANKTFARINWNFFLTNDGKMPNETFFSMGYHENAGFLDARWRDFNELMTLEIPAYALWDKMPIASWDKWDRDAVEYDGLHFFRGGALFMHQMAEGFFDFKNRRDRLGYDYWVDGKNATLAQIAYCKANPQHYEGYGANIWGLSACDVPDGYDANGAPVDVHDTGTLAPAAAVASAPFTPEESMKAADAFVKQYPDSYGIYGFTTGLNPSKHWHSDFVIGIDLGQVMLNIENYRDNGPHSWMMSQPRVKKAFERIGLKVTSEGPVNSRALYVEPKGS
ncbi:MAG TPA: glucoamylase family protein [Fimbriimonadaceae bacterium]|jgi:hypothetical protein